MGRREQAAVVSVVMGVVCWLWVAEASQAARPEAHTEVSGSMAEMVAAPSATPPPSWQVVGH